MVSIIVPLYKGFNLSIYSCKVLVFSFFVVFCSLFPTSISFAGVANSISADFGNTNKSTLRMATWNILNLGATTAVDKRAKVISAFDFVGLQEIESPSGFKKLVKAVEKNTDDKWDSVLSKETGHGGAAEYYGFLWRTSKVKILPGPRGIYPEVEDSDFSREPFFATFVAGKFQFTALNIHVTWGKNASFRRAEVSRLSEVAQYVESLCAGDSNIIIMGDFNVHRPDASAFSPLIASGFSPLISSRLKTVFSTYSTSEKRIGSRFYDNIWVSPKTLKRANGNEGIFKPHRYFFKTRRYPHLHVRKRISDHCPVWADLSIL